MEPISAILFDWDGTLLDSYPSSYLASLKVFQYYGMELDRKSYLATYNPNWYETYRRVGIPSEEWATADRIWRQTYAESPPDLYPFARRTLEALRQCGYSLGLVTSGNRDRVTRELDRHQIATLFSVKVCFEDTNEKKPHPAPLAASTHGPDPRIAHFKD